MLARVQQTIVEHGLLDRGDRVLVGLSGGPDSWALLLALLKLRDRLGITIEAACVDHGLRPESAREARAVVRQCRARGVKAVVLKVDVASVRGRGVSLQDAARRVRLAALADLAARRLAMRIALGHNAEDQAETILFRIVRGTGIAGLRGIPYRRDLFIRPLLDVSRADIERFVRRQGVVWIDDPSNLDPRHTRVRVRHEWLSLLRRENPRIVEALRALGRDAARQGSISADLSDAAGRPLYLQRRAADVVRSLSGRGAGTRHVSVRGGRVEVRYGQPVFKPGPAPTAAARTGQPGPGLPGDVGDPAPKQRTVPGPGRFQLGPGLPMLEVKVLKRAPSKLTEALFDAEHVGWPLILRGWRAGDRMHPRGGPGRRKLQDLFTDAKVPRPERASSPVVTNLQGQILFVAGLRPAHIGRPGAETRLWLRLTTTKSSRSRR